MDRSRLGTRPYLQSILMMLLVLCAPAVSFCQATWTASGHTTVADPAPGNRGPRVGLFDDGSALVFWGEPGGNLWVARQTPATGIFLDPVMVDVGSTVPFVSSIEGPEMAVWGLDRAYIAYVTTGGEAWLASSSDGGATWASSRMSPPGVNVILAQVAVSPDGHPVGAWIQDNPTEYTWEIAESTDFGATFGSSTPANSAASGFNVCECCPSTLLISGDTAALLFRNNDSNVRDIWAAVSTDGGASFPDAVDIDPTDWVISGCPATGPDGVMSEDSVYTAWVTGAFGSTQIWVSALDRSTLTAGTARQLSPEGARDPQVAGGGSDVGVVWHVAGPGSREVFFAGPALSTPAAAGFHEPVKLSADGVLAGYADIAYKDDGSFVAVWEEAGTVQFAGIFADAPSTGIEESGTGSFRVWRDGAGMLRFEALDFQPQRLEIYDLQGRLLKSVSKPVTGSPVAIPRQMLVIKAEDRDGHSRIARLSH